MPLLLRIVVAGGLMLGASSLGAAYLAAENAHDAIQRVEREGLERDYALCTSSNEARAGILAFIRQLAALDGDPTDDGEVLSLAEDTFAQITCPPDPTP